MRRRLLAVALIGTFVATFCGSRLLAVTTVTWDGTTSNQWHEANWTLNGTPGLTANAAIGQDGNTGGRGGVDMIIGNGAHVEMNQNRSGSPPSGDPNGQGDFKPRHDLCGGVTCPVGTSPGGSLTIKEGAVLSMDSHTDTDGRWSRMSLDLNLDSGTFIRTKSLTSESGGKIIFGYHGELLENQKVNINITHGGKIQNSGKMIFGEPDLAPNVGHSKGIEVAMTINDGMLDLTGGADYPDYFGLADGELIFFYEYDTNNNLPLNEKYSINFTGPGSIIVDKGIYAAAKDSEGNFNPLGGPSDLFTPITYEALWNLGILQANGQSGATGATFSNFFSTTGTTGSDNYTLTSLIPGGVTGDYNGNGVVDAADYVLWRNDPGSHGGAPGGYNTWRANFGNHAGTGSGLGASAVPEPTSLVLFLMGWAAVGVRRRS